MENIDIQKFLLKTFKKVSVNDIHEIDIKINFLYAWSGNT